MGARELESEEAMIASTPPFLHVHPEVADALSARQPVVALESTVIAHGLP